VASRLLSLLTERPALIASLPTNSPDLARAAADGGADALKVHLHVRHEASDTQFGDLATERKNLDAILAIGLPTGVVPGAGDYLPTPEEMHELAAMGLDFFDLYAHDMPAWLVGFEGLTRAIAIDYSWQPDDLAQFAGLGFDLLEAAVVPHEGYGRPLNAADLAAYRKIRQATAMPIIVPTQRAIRPDEAALLTSVIGVNAIMIGVIVAGREPEGFRVATALFAKALAAAYA
jgi:hypothetical protein